MSVNLNLQYYPLVFVLVVVHMLEVEDAILKFFSRVEIPNSERAAFPKIRSELFMEDAKEKSNNSGVLWGTLLGKVYHNNGEHFCSIDFIKKPIGLCFTPFENWYNQDVFVGRMIVKPIPDF